MMSNYSVSYTVYLPVYIFPYTLKKQMRMTFIIHFSKISHVINLLKYPFIYVILFNIVFERRNSL